MSDIECMGKYYKCRHPEFCKDAIECLSKSKNRKTIARKLEIENLYCKYGLPTFFKAMSEAYEEMYTGN